MISETSTRTVIVALPQRLVSALLEVRDILSVEVEDLLQAPVAPRTPEAARHDRNPRRERRPTFCSEKHSAEFLGLAIGAQTLPEIFVRIVDMTALVAPEVLDRLSEMRASKRRYVARDPQAIHPGRPDLAVKRTGSGWWISGNIGRKDLERALNALAEAAGLIFGKDIRLGPG